MKWNHTHVRTTLRTKTHVIQFASEYAPITLLWAHNAGNVTSGDAFKEGEIRKG